MKNKRASILSGIYASSLALAMNEFTNPVRYSGGKKPERKTPLTKKQKKARAKAKSARKARRKQRR